MPSYPAFSVRQRIVLYVAIVVIAGLGSACSGAEQTLEDMPEWMAEKPDAAQHILGTGTGMSTGLQTALEKASARAREDIASTIEIRFQGLTKDFQEEVGDEYLSQFVQAQKEITDQFLRGTQVRKRTVHEENGRYRAYVLMEMPIGQASQELMSKLKQNEDLYTRFRASEAFEELRRAVSQYEQAKSDTPQ